MTDQFAMDLKDTIFGEKGLNPDLLIHLAPYLTEPLLSRAISIAYAVSDPYQRALILLALAESAHLSDAGKKALVDAAREAEHEISSQPERIKVLKKILLLTASQDPMSRRTSNSSRAGSRGKMGIDAERDLK